MEIFKNTLTTYLNKKTEDENNVLTRIILFEKCKIHDYESMGGLKYWYDKNGKTIRVDNKNSTLDLTKFAILKGEKDMFVNTNTGYIYAPYIPVLNTELLYDTNFQPNNIIQTRYATAMINNRFYGTVTL